MLKYVKRLLPYPPTGVSNLIYSIANDEALRKKVKYNPISDSFEIPVSEIKNFTDICNIGNRRTNKIIGTNIYWGIDQKNFYFWLGER